MWFKMYNFNWKISRFQHKALLGTCPFRRLPLHHSKPTSPLRSFPGPGAHLPLALGPWPTRSPASPGRPTGSSRIHSHWARSCWHLCSWFVLHTPRVKLKTMTLLCVFKLRITAVHLCSPAPLCLQRHGRITALKTGAEPRPALNSHSYYRT